MTPLADAFDALSEIIVYPEAHLQDRLESCTERIEPIDSDAAGLLREFSRRIAGKTLSELEEVYIQTFDMNPTRTLDLGWQLFGEDYNRGIFLVKVRQEMKRLGIDETHELPDHITQVLKVLGRMEPDKAEDFAVACVLPALRKTCGAVNEDNPYRPLVEAVVQLLAANYQESTEEANDGALV
ncbi:MAG: hypothetical protein KJ052_05940 [Candidatus Hydrogenedentes bacterium]|nr:hypothetical protein [Candidatus Hydrogenedentota bacterium]